MSMWVELMIMGDLSVGLGWAIARTLWLEQRFARRRPDKGREWITVILAEVHMESRER